MHLRDAIRGSFRPTLIPHPIMRVHGRFCLEQAKPYMYLERVLGVLESTFVYAYLQMDYTMISDQYWNYLYHMNTYSFSTEPMQLYNTAGGNDPATSEMVADILPMQQLLLQ